MPISAPQNWNYLKNKPTTIAGFGISDLEAAIEALAGFGKSLAANGYQKLPSNLIIQWGVTGSMSDGTVTFPIAFPNAVYSIAVSDNGAAWAAVNGKTLTTFDVQQRKNTSGYAVATGEVSWIAIGK